MNLLNQMILKKLKKQIISILSVIFIFMFSLGDAVAYEFPANSYYIKFVDSSLGEITLYIPSNQVSYISLEENLEIINTSSSNITAYTNDSTYSISFQPFSIGRYRTGTSQNYTNLNIIEILDTNLPNQSKSSFFINSNIDFITVGLLVIGGAFLLLIWLKL